MPTQTTNDVMEEVLVTSEVRFELRVQTTGSDRDESLGYISFGRRWRDVKAIQLKLFLYTGKIHHFLFKRSSDDSGAFEVDYQRSTYNENTWKHEPGDEQYELAHKWVTMALEQYGVLAATALGFD